MANFSSPSNSREEQRDLIQGRLALLGKVMFGITALLCLVQGLLGPTKDLFQPSYWLLVAGCGFWLVLFLDCRGAPRSGTRLRVVEAGCLVGWVASVGISVRLLMVDQAHVYMTLASGNEIAQASLIALHQKEAAVALVLAISYALILRAAVVPTTPRYTTWLSISAGVAYVLIWIIEPAQFELPVELSLAKDQGLVTVVGIWWGLTTIVCSVVSRVVFGLRTAVHDAQKLGQYTLVSKIGAGGMGVVYRAQHAMMQRPTAIKLLSDPEASELQLVRFEREVQLTAKLTHPNTITIFDYGRTPDGVFYYVMELLDGASLEAVIQQDGPQPAERVVAILLQLTGALEEAHSIGLIHRDIKPANVILCSQGGRPDVAKLLDFGLVKELHLEEVSDVTVDGSAVGTPLYMSPEQIATPQSVDGRSDLYSLGALGYYALTGHHLFESETAIALCADHLHTKPIPPSERSELHVPADLEAVILACLEKSPADRPGSAAELAERLRACDLETWSVERARSWWRVNGNNFESGDASESGARTIAIDLARGR